MYKIILFCFFIGKFFLSIQPMTEVRSADDVLRAINWNKPLPNESTVEYFEDFRKNFACSDSKVAVDMMLFNYYYSSVTSDNADENLDKAIDRFWEG